MPPKTHRTRYFDIVIDDRIMTLRRTGERFEVHGLYEACSPALEILRSQKHLGLIIDLRGVRGRADAGFEEAFKPIRKELVSGHPRVATIVETAVGQLQMQRQIRGDSGPTVQRVFLDEDAAFRFASGD